MLPQLETVPMPADAVEVARIAEPWGVKGWFKVHAHSTAPEALFSCKRWFLLPAATPGLDGTVTLMRITQAKQHGSTVVAGAQGIDDRDAAQALRGARVFIPRASFPTPEPDEYYWVDLIGLDVVNLDGIHLGRVSELLKTAAQTVMVCAYDADGKTSERMIPFVAVYVVSVDLPGRCIRVDWQPDY